MILKNSRRIIAIVIVVPFLFLSCESNGNESRYDPPADHTVSQDGAMHKSGLNQPLTNCVACHGNDLKGGSSQVSCYECHGKEW